jgi:hypothetical protein
VNMGTVRDLMDIIASGYASSPGAIERAIATKVVAYFQERGWLSATDVAYLVEAAGGEIRVPESLTLDPAPLLQWTNDPANGEMIIRSIDKARLVKNATVNPEAESRNVDSGPITIRPATPQE